MNQKYADELDVGDRIMLGERAYEVRHVTELAAPYRLRVEAVASEGHKLMVEMQTTDTVEVDDE